MGYPVPTGVVVWMASYFVIPQLGRVTTVCTYSNEPRPPKATAEHDVRPLVILPPETFVNSPPELPSAITDPEFVQFFQANVVEHLRDWAPSEAASHYISWACANVTLRPIGFVYFYVLDAKPHSELFALGVDPDYRRWGIGIDLLKAGVDASIAFGAERIGVKWACRDASKLKLKPKFERMMKAEYAHITLDQRVRTSAL